MMGTIALQEPPAVPTVSADVLEQFATSLFLAGGVAEAGAKIVAKSLIEANLRGHDSHGVIDPKAQLKVERETPASLVCDGGWGLGQVLAHDLMQRLIAKCTASAIA